MIGTTKAFVGLASGGFVVAWGSIIAVHKLQGEQLDLVERYGLLGLHALVVIGIGGAMVKVGWDLVAKLGVLVATNEKIATVLDGLAAQQLDDRRSNDAERDKAVGTVLDELRETRKALMDESIRAREESRRGRR